MKTLSVALDSHMQQEVTTIARCWKIVRTDGVTFYFTAHDVDIPFEGQTYLASSGFMPTAIENKSDLSVDNVNVQGIFDDAAIKESDLRAGLFDFADVYLFVVNWMDTTQGKMRLRRGKLGEVLSTPQGWFSAELRGMTQQLQQKVIELYGPECRADLGDARCKIPLNPPLRANTTAYNSGDFIRVVTNGGGFGQEQYEDRIYQCTTAGTTAGAAPTYDTTVGHTTTDGTTVFTTVQAWTRNAVVATVTDNSHFTITITEPRDVDGWFDEGVLTFETGNNTNVSGEVKVWTQSGAHVEMYLPFYFPINVGDKLRVSPGCDKSRSMCTTKFANLGNMRAESDLPGNDQLFFYPDATG